MLFLFILILALLCGFLFFAFIRFKPAQQPDKTMEETKKQEKARHTMLAEMPRLYEENNDTAGWIYIEGTEVDYPVMYTPEDGEFYLHRTFEKEEDPTGQGCIFIDKHCTTDPRSTNLLFHGHSMNNGTMFATLLDYKDEEFYKKHPTIIYTSLVDEAEYQIAAVFLSKVYTVAETDVFKYYKFYDAATEEEYNDYIENCKALALYDTGFTPKYGDELITLSTCEYSVENGRIVVVAYKTKEVVPDHDD